MWCGRKATRSLILPTPDAFETGIADAQLTVIDGAGYAIAVEQPEELASAISTFLDKNGTPSKASASNSS